MRQTVKLPKLGDTTTEVLVIEWIAAVGDTLSPEDPLLSVETDKVDADVPTPVGGQLVEQLVAEGDEVPIGAPIAVIER